MSDHASRVQDATRTLLDAELRLASLRKVVESASMTTSASRCAANKANR